MAKIVELFGSPGVGKTTIYRTINARWSKKYNWIPSHYLCPHPSLSIRYISKFLSYVPKRITGKRRSTYYEDKLEAGKRFVEQHPEYMDACWNDLIIKQKKTLNGLDIRLKKAEMLGQQIQVIQFLKESETDKVAILEEGLVHLLDVLSFCDEYEKIIQILNVMPLPDALVSISIDVSENVRRLMQREEMITLHRSFNTDQLQQITEESHRRRILINKALKEKGVPILEIDGKASVEDNTDKIISFAERLYVPGNLVVC